MSTRSLIIKMKIIYLLVNDNDDLLSIFTLPVVFILIEFFFHGLYKGACHFQSLFPVGSNITCRNGTERTVFDLSPPRPWERIKTGPSVN